MRLHNCVLTGLEVLDYFCFLPISCSFHLTHKGSGADVHKSVHTHTETHGTPCLSLCVQPWRLQQKPFILSGSQSFRPIRDRQCSEGIQILIQDDWLYFTRRCVSASIHCYQRCLCRSLHELDVWTSAGDVSPEMKKHKKVREGNNRVKGQHLMHSYHQSPLDYHYGTTLPPPSFACFFRSSLENNNVRTRRLDCPRASSSSTITNDSCYVGTADNTKHT